MSTDDPYYNKEYSVLGIMSKNQRRASTPSLPRKMGHLATWDPTSRAKAHRKSYDGKFGNFKKSNVEIYNSLKG